MPARLSFDTSCELGFYGSLNEWERLMGQLPGGEYRHMKRCDQQQRPS
jgi:hypothetical protein